MLADTLLDKPFIIDSCSGFGVITSETSTIHGVAKLWAEQFPQQQDTILCDNTQAPLLAQHGSTELQRLWDLVLNKQHLVQATDAIAMNNVCVYNQRCVAFFKCS